MPKFWSKGAVTKKTKTEHHASHQNAWDDFVGENTRFKGVDSTCKCQREGNSRTKGSRG